MVLAVEPDPEAELCQQNGHHSKVEWIDKILFTNTFIELKIVNYQPKKKSNLI
jgi:hypothetical protein